MPKARLLATVWVMFCAAAAWAQQCDARHRSNHHAPALYRSSAFAHGYVHGYEDGFHLADLDVHMARLDGRRVEDTREYKQAAGFRSDFGSRNLFRDGYRAGFRTGYSDGLGRREFRATEALRAAGEGLPQDGVMHSAQFDSGFELGYRSGLDYTSLALPAGNLGWAQEHCASLSSGSKQRPAEYCEGYARGFQLGASDGRLKEAPKAAQARR